MSSLSKGTVGFFCPMARETKLYPLASLSTATTTANIATPTSPTLAKGAKRSKGSGGSGGSVERAKGKRGGSRAGTRDVDRQVLVRIVRRLPVVATVDALREARKRGEYDATLAGMSEATWLPPLRAAVAAWGSEGSIIPTSDGDWTPSSPRPASRLRLLLSSLPQVNFLLLFLVAQRSAAISWASVGITAEAPGAESAKPPKEAVGAGEAEAGAAPVAALG
eukprot:CAMPEP_0170737064 /NCGR_PEP_ID=MMETSP0437-20130122/3935_1 /TAXON_ID=0 /ORGANISM="Sexangularia sp." /LENGTH=221 /DNA_ID=CAMNT_0011075441 /DNA_START=162 /DNA_END=823 /DNA_ORIENTATION=-